MGDEIRGAPEAVHQLLLPRRTTRGTALEPLLVHADVSGIGPEGVLYHVPRALNVRTESLGGSLGLQALHDQKYLCQEKLDGVCSRPGVSPPPPPRLAPMCAGPVRHW